MNGRLPCLGVGRVRARSFRLVALLWLAAVSCAAATAPANAAAVLADLSSHIIAIGGGFTGDSVVLFGSTDGPGDIIAVVRGPERDVTVWRKGKVAGIWVNAEFGDVQQYPGVLRRGRQPAARSADPALRRRPVQDRHGAFEVRNRVAVVLRARCACSPMR